MARVLAVDDDERALKLVSSIVGSLGCEVSTASSGREALAKAAERRPDIVLLDVMMPEMDGFEVARRLKADPAMEGVPIVMLTALTDRKSLERGLELGVEEFVPKPLHAGELRLRVRNLLRLKALSDSYAELAGMQAVALRSECLARQTAEAELDRTLAVWHSIGRHSPDDISMIDPDGTVRVVNRTPPGKTAAEVLGTSAFDRFDRCDASRVRAAATAALETPGETRQIECRGLRRDGSRGWLAVRLGRIDDGASDAQLLLVVTDITGRVDAADKLREQAAQLEQARRLEAIGRLAGGVAHDFNNMIGVILSYAELLLLELPSGSRCRDDATEIMNAGQRAAEVAAQLLAFSRQQVPAARLADPNSIIEHTRKMLRRLLTEEIQLVCDLDEDAHQVYIDPGQLAQVVVNLAVNARDAMPRGGRLVVSTRMRELPEQDGDLQPGPYTVLSVCDTGGGIAALDLPRIFEPFFTTKAAGEGTGLGLATVHGVVSNAGGDVRVTTEEGVGTTFTILLPAAGLQPQTSARGPVDSDDWLLVGRETVLVVEDEDALRRAVVRGLERYGYRVLSADNPGEALLIGEDPSVHIDVLLTDVVMPYMRGDVLAARLQTVRPALQVLFMSGYTGEEPAYADRLISKPFKPQQVARRLRALFDDERESAVA